MSQNSNSNVGFNVVKNNARVLRTIRILQLKDSIHNISKSVAVYFATVEKFYTARKAEIERRNTPEAAPVKSNNNDNNNNVAAEVVENNSVKPQEIAATNTKTAIGNKESEIIDATVIEEEEEEESAHVSLHNSFAAGNISSLTDVVLNYTQAIGADTSRSSRTTEETAADVDVKKENQNNNNDNEKNTTTKVAEKDSNLLKEENFKLSVTSLCEHDYTYGLPPCSPAHLPHTGTSNSTTTTNSNTTKTTNWLDNSPIYNIVTRQGHVLLTSLSGANRVTDGERVVVNLKEKETGTSASTCSSPSSQTSAAANHTKTNNTNNNGNHFETATNTTLNTNLNDNRQIIRQIIGVVSPETLPSLLAKFEAQKGKGEKDETIHHDNENHTNNKSNKDGDTKNHKQKEEIFSIRIPLLAVKQDTSSYCETDNDNNNSAIEIQMKSTPVLALKTDLTAEERSNNNNTDSEKQRKKKEMRKNFDLYKHYERLVLRNEFELLHQLRRLCLKLLGEEEGEEKDKEINGHNQNQNNNRNNDNVVILKVPVYYVYVSALDSSATRLIQLSRITNFAIDYVSNSNFFYYHFKHNNTGKKMITPSNITAANSANNSVPQDLSDMVNANTNINQMPVQSDGSSHSNTLNIFSRLSSGVNVNNNSNNNENTANNNHSNNSNNSTTVARTEVKTNRAQQLLYYNTVLLQSFMYLLPTSTTTNTETKESGKGEEEKEKEEEVLFLIKTMLEFIDGVLATLEPSPSLLPTPSAGRETSHGSVEETNININNNNNVAEISILSEVNSTTMNGSGPHFYEFKKQIVTFLLTSRLNPIPNNNNNHAAVLLLCSRMFRPPSTLVHCLQGVSRSASVVLVYFMWMYQAFLGAVRQFERTHRVPIQTDKTQLVSYAGLLEAVQAVRPVVRPNVCFAVEMLSMWQAWIDKQHN